MKLLEVLFIATGFGIFEATDMTLLQTFMEKNLSPRPPARLLAQNPGSPHSPPSPICPKEIKVSWQLRPPYTLEDKNSTDDQPTINGIFHHALEFALEKCCLFYRGNKSIMRYLAMSDNSTALKHTTFAEDSIIAFPIQRDWYIGSRRRYINILDSPGVVIIQRGPSHTTAERRAQLFKAILETWPVVVLSLLLSSLAGIVIWMLVRLALYLKRAY